MGQQSHIIVPQQLRELYDSELRRYLALGPLLALDKPSRIKGLHRDGREFPAEITTAPIRQGKSYGLMSYVRDLTERKRLEFAVRASEERKMILNNIQDGYCEVDLHGNYEFANEVYCQAIQPNLRTILRTPISDNSPHPRMFSSYTTSTKRCTLPGSPSEGSSMNTNPDDSPKCPWRSGET